MSLFKCKEWWSVNLNETELYDSQCMLVSAVGKDRYQSILLGNHHGMFRVYGPTSGLADDGTVIGYRPSDLLLEIHFPAPILHMALGNFVSGCHDQNLAILHPKLLTVFAINRKEGKTADGDQMSLDPSYHHQLRHSAFSMVAGAFGSGRGRDFICVQSLDGLLSFYEQESFAFQLYLPDFLLPSSFLYLDSLDCFVFLNSSLIFDCYSYESLASGSRSASDSNPTESPKKILKYWSYNIGESVLDLRLVHIDKHVILALTERNFYGISESGKSLFAKRLDYVPVSMHAFITAESKKLIVLIASDNHLLNIYDGTCLKWSMKVDQIPVSIDRIILSNLYGGIVLLSESGYLQCVYLGTRPSVYLAPPMNQADVNVDEAEAELKRLQIEITQRDTADPADEIDLLGVRLAADPNGTVSVEISNQTPVNKIQVVLHVDPPLATTGKSSVLVSCCDTALVENSVSLNRPGVVSDLSILAYVSYVNESGTPFVIERRGRLPLSLVAVRATPTKEAKHKLTLVTNKPVCPLNVIFRDLAGEDEGNPNVFALRYVNSESVVTVLAAKTTQRYRLQSDSLPAVALILTSLIERLRAHYKGASDLILTYDGALPLQTYFEELEKYHELLERRKSAREKLSKRTCQYRTIQKKVLVNLKDVTPKPISNLNNLLRDTYEMIVSSVAEIEGIEGELEMCRYSINALCVLLIALLELMTVAETDLGYLRMVFSGNVYDSDEQGWLEAQYAAAAFFLRTTMAKSARDQQKSGEITLNPVTSISKVLKTFSAVVDRATKGTHLLERSEYEHDREPLATIPGAKVEEIDDDDGVVPKGARLATLDTILQRDPSPSVMQARKDKRLIKQERVDSLGTISEPSAEDDPSSQQARQETRDEAKTPSEHIEGDSIWDVKVDDMLM